MTDIDTTATAAPMPGQMFPLTPAPPTFPFSSHVDPDAAPDAPPTELAAGKPDGELGAGPTGQLFRVSGGEWVRASGVPGAPEVPAEETVKVPVAEEIAEAIVLLNDAKERLAVNALSDVGYFIGRAIQILEG
jgi:hypothetical protein